MRTHLGWSSGKGNLILRGNWGIIGLWEGDIIVHVKRECHYVMELWHKAMKTVELM